LALGVIAGLLEVVLGGLEGLLVGPLGGGDQVLVIDTLA